MCSLLESRLFGTTRRITYCTYDRGLSFFYSIATLSSASDSSSIENSTGEPLPWRIETRCFPGEYPSGFSSLSPLSL